MSRSASRLWPVLAVTAVALVGFAVAMRMASPSPLKNALDGVARRAGLGGLYDRVHVSDEQGHELDVRLQGATIVSAELDGVAVPGERVRLGDDVVTVLAEDGAVQLAMPLTEEGRWLLEMPAGAEREAWLTAKRAEQEADRTEREGQDARELAALARTNELLAAEIARQLGPALELALTAAPPAALGVQAASTAEAPRAALAGRAAAAAVEDLSRDASARLAADGSVTLLVLTQPHELSRELVRSVERELQRADLELEGAARDALRRAIEELARGLAQVELTTGS